MRRREFITLFGGAAVSWPLAARAQHMAMPVVGFLNGASPGRYVHVVEAFRDGLRETGYVEGQNVVIEYRWAEGQYDRLPDLAADLVRRQVSVIAANTLGSLAAKAATRTIPIVFTTGSDPVQLGLVESLNRPGGNLTGITQLTEEVAPKRIELAHELIPTASVVGLLINPKNFLAKSFTDASRKAATTLGLQVEVVHASTEAELDAAFSAFRQMRVDALAIGGDNFFNNQSELLATLAIRYLLPSVYQNHEFTAAGGLVSYGGNLLESYHIAGVYTGRILKGDKPANLPVQRSTKVELIINLKTAKALGLTVPPSLLARADEVIE